MISSAYMQPSLELVEPLAFAAAAIRIGSKMGKITDAF